MPNSKNKSNKKPSGGLNSLNEPKKLSVNGTLDLHTFRPEDLGSLIPGYIKECIDRDIFEIRIIHGKGTGNLRRSVHALLDRNPHVETYSLAGDRSGWGATVASLKKPE